MEKNEQQLPRLGEPVPAFEAMTTRGKISFPADYKGKWVILFSHPADFTPICTSEVLTFGARTAEFRALNCELIGLSVDSRNSHIAWLRTIREKIEYRGMKDIKVEFPIIDDVSMKVANLYGMIQPGESQTAAVRAVFFVDPEGKLRAMIYYPLALGRNFEEIKRVLVGLQSIDAFGVAMPADWRPGDEVIVPMQGEDMDDQPEGVKCYDWFFCTRPLPKEEIEKKLGKGIAITGSSGSGRHCKGGGLCKAPFYIDSAVVLSVTLQNLYISREECFLFLLYLGVYIKILNIMAGI